MQMGGEWGGDKRRSERVNGGREEEESKGEDGGAWKDSHGGS